MTKFRFHKFASVAVLVGFAAWMGTGKFSSVGSASAENEPATPKQETAAEQPKAAPRTVAVISPPRVQHARAIRISGGKLQQIRYLATYQTKPISAVTHYAPVAKIEPYGESGKYQLIFSSAPLEITPIPFADAPAGLMQGPRYTTLGKLRSAKALIDLF